MNILHHKDIIQNLFENLDFDIELWLNLFLVSKLWNIIAFNILSKRLILHKIILTSFLYYWEPPLINNHTILNIHSSNPKYYKKSISPRQLILDKLMLCGKTHPKDYFMITEIYSFDDKLYYLDYPISHHYKIPIYNNIINYPKGNLKDIQLKKFNMELKFLKRYIDDQDSKDL